MGTTLYIEPSSGVAGDMLLSALCCLTDGYEEIQSLPDKLHLHDGKVEINELNKNGIVCKHINIIDTGSGSDNHTHSHDHDHGHSHHHGHRHLSDIITLIDKGHISDGAKTIAKAIFNIIGESEAKIHGIPIEKIHFHEVSGVDSILDIVGCSVLIDKLQIDHCYSDPICVGYGNVNTQHGVLPVPAPATADILLGIPCFKGDESGERTTPTGAAIVKYLNPIFESPTAPATKNAYGPGKKDFKSANVVRLSILDENAVQGESDVWTIETNLDDMSPEFLGTDFQSGLLANGALDFHISQVTMKKGRAGLLLSALAPTSKRDATIDYILEHTTAIGLRYFPCQRKVLQRKAITMDTEFGPIPAKRTTKPSGSSYVKFEYEALKDIASKNNISLVELKQRLDGR